MEMFVDLLLPNPSRLTSLMTATFSDWRMHTLEFLRRTGYLNLNPNYGDPLLGLGPSRGVLTVIIGNPVTSSDHFQAGHDFHFSSNYPVDLNFLLSGYQSLHNEFFGRASHVMHNIVVTQPDNSTPPRFEARVKWWFNMPTRQVHTSLDNIPSMLKLAVGTDFVPAMWFFHSGLLSLLLSKGVPNL